MRAKPEHTSCPDQAAPGCPDFRVHPAAPTLGYTRLPRPVRVRSWGGWVRNGITIQKSGLYSLTRMAYSQPLYLGYAPLRRKVHFARVCSRKWQGGTMRMRNSAAPRTHSERGPGGDPIVLRPRPRPTRRWRHLAEGGRRRPKTHRGEEGRYRARARRPPRIRAPIPRVRVLSPKDCMML